MEETASNTAAGLRILVVEDHGDSAIAISRLLRLFGHKPQVAGNLSTAFALAENDNFDLVICDIRLPDGSGLDLMRRLRDLGPIKGIAVSGLASEVEQQASRDAGFSTHLAKPLDFSRLRETISDICTPCHPSPTNRG